MDFGRDDKNLIEFKKNEFELANTQTNGEEMFSHLKFLSPATLAAFMNIESLVNAFSEAKNRKISGEEWQKMSQEERVMHRMSVENEEDDLRIKIAMRSQAGGSSEFFGHASKFGLGSETEGDFSDLMFDVYEDVLAETEETEDMSEQERAALELKKQQEMEQRNHETEILTYQSEIESIKEQIEQLPEQVRAANREYEADDPLRLGEKELLAKIEEDKDTLLYELSRAEMKLNVLTMPEEERRKYDERVEAEGKQYAEYARIVHQRIKDAREKGSLPNDVISADPTLMEYRIQRHVIMEFAEEMSKRTEDKDGNKVEPVKVDWRFLYAQYQRYLSEASIRNERSTIVKDGTINDDYKEEGPYSRSINLDTIEGQDIKNIPDYYQDAGGQVVGDKNGMPFEKRTAPTSTQTSTASSFSNTTTSTNSTSNSNTTTNTQRRMYTDSNNINAEDLSSTIERSVAMQKEREKIKMRHLEEEFEQEAGLVDDEPATPRQTTQQAPQPTTETEPKRRGFFSFFRRKKEVEPRKTLAERYNEYMPGKQASVFNSNHKPENYYEFRATTKSLAERGMLLGGAGAGPLLPSKEEQMREVNRVRGFKRKVRAYVRTHRFRVTVKVAAYCAFTIGLAMIGGEASIENREQYVMAFVSMFGGLLLMNSIREDGIDLPAMPFGAPRKNNDGNSGSSRAQGPLF